MTNKTEQSVSAEAFCQIYNSHYGDEIDNVKQLKQVRFSGEELLDFLNHAVTQLQTSPKVEEGQIVYVPIDEKEWDTVKGDMFWADEIKRWLKPVTVPLSSSDRLTADRSKDEVIMDEIAGIMYENTSDQSDDGSWINSGDFHKVASFIYMHLQKLTADKDKEMREMLASLSELTRSVIRIDNTNPGAVLSCDVERVVRAHELMKKYSNDNPNEILVQSNPNP